MNNTSTHSNGYNLYYALLISVLLHFILLLVLSINNNWINIKKNQLSFSDKVEQMRFEIVKTPDNIAHHKPDQKTFLLSDKDSRVSDVNRKDINKGKLPFSQGNVEVKDITSNNTGTKQGGTDQGANKQLMYEKNKNIYREETENRYEQEYSNFDTFSKHLLTKKRPATHSGSQNVQPKYNQTEMDAPNRGGITFNTYNWDFAPYLLYLKEKIQNNIYPPTSFTRLGFSGENIIRFKIFPDGKLVQPNVRGYKGSEALVETSVKAIEMSAPFRPLPEDFPENFLIVTAKFSYYLLSNN